MRYPGVILAACLAAGAAFADTPDIGRPGAAPKPIPAPNYPQSVWRVTGGTAEHLQSGLVCSHDVYTFRAVSVQTFDRYGLDVSCGYTDGGAGALTVYLTRVAPDLDLGAIFASAKGALTKAGAAKHPVLAGEDRPADGGLAWMRATYAEDAGVRTSVWMARLAPDWLVQYRATYPAEHEGPAFAALSRITRQVEASAGARLKLCAAVAPPARTGVRITDAEELRAQAMAASLADGAAPGQAEGAGKPVDMPPAAWCLEGPASANAIPMLFWRGVRADGSDARVDRVTVMTTGPAPELDIGFDSVTYLGPAGPAGGALTRQLWTAASHQVGQTWIYGYFNGRPGPAAAGAFFADVLQRRARALGGYQADSRTANPPPP